MIPLVFFILFLLTLWFVIGSKGHWIPKAIMTGATLHLCVSIGLSLSGFAGWPSQDEVPKRFLVHWIVIKEPAKGTSEKGAIYLWATSISKEKETPAAGWRALFPSLYSPDTTQPRAYAMPYSKQKHQKADEAISKIKGGKIVVGERGGGGKEGAGDGDGANGEGPSGQGVGGGSFSQSDDISFHELPPSSLPKK
jgi:hypothetical protein